MLGSILCTQTPVLILVATWLLFGIKIGSKTKAPRIEVVDGHYTSKVGYHVLMIVFHTYGYLPCEVCTKRLHE